MTRVRFAPCGCSLLKVANGLCDAYRPEDVPALERGEFPSGRDTPGGSIHQPAVERTLRELLRCPACRQHFDEQICLVADDLDRTLTREQVVSAKQLLTDFHKRHG